MMVEKWEGLMISDKNNNKIFIKIVNAYIHTRGKTCKILSLFGLVQNWGIDNKKENWEREEGGVFGWGGKNG